MVDGRGGEGREKRKKREKSGNGGVDESVGVGGWVRSGCGVRLWGCMCGGIVRGGDDCGGCEKWFGFVVLTVRKWLGGGGTSEESGGSGVWGRGSKDACVGWPGGRQCNHGVQQPATVAQLPNDAARDYPPDILYREEELL